MNFSRKTILVVGAALLAACGDKVTVQEYTPPPTQSKVNSVEVSPATATVSTGQSITFTAAVNADAGLATTVTWTASAGTITSAGVFTAPATGNPGIAVCATSTVDTGKKGCATVVVSPPVATIPATVSINSITASGNLNGTVNPAAVAGPIDVTVNVNPGNQTISKVEVLFGSVVAYSQTFTAAQAAALRYAADEAAAAQTTFPQIVAMINTAAFNATTGVPTWLNGATTLQAKVYTVASGSSQAASASVTQTLTLANVDGFAITTSGGTSAVDGTGYRWTGNGSLTVNALPVLYSGSSIGTVAAALSANPATGSTCVGAVGAIGTATTKTDNVYVITGTLAGLQSPAGCVTTFPNVVTVTATNSAGDNLTLAGTATTPAGIIGTQTGLRWDNVAPPTAGLIAALAVNGRTGNWINDAVSLNTVTAAGNPNGAIAATVVDAGIGGAITYNVRVGATYTAAKTAAAIADPTTLAASATNASYCGIVYTADVLGNTQTANPGGTCAAPTAVAGYALPVAGSASVPFGVDRAAPTIAYDATSLAANAQKSTATIAGEFVVTVNDTGLVGNSGMAPTAPVTMQITQRVAGTANSAGTNNPLNANGTAATTAGVLSATGVVAAAPLYSTAVTALTTDAYYSFNATAFDAAGNSASVSARTIVLDNGALTVGNVSTPITVSTIGWTGSAFLNDALDIANYWFSGDYAAIGGVSTFVVGPSAQPVRFANTTPTTVNGFNAATFVNTNYAVSAVFNLPLALQFGGTLYPLATVEANATNQGLMLVTGAAAAAPAVSPALAVFAPTGLATFPAVTNSIASNNISSGVTTAATTANPASGTLSVVSTGPTATYNNPFSRVEFWAANNGGAAGTEMRLIGTATTPVLTDNGAVRTFTWSAAISGATLYSQLGFTATNTTNVIAVGYNAAGTIGYVNALAYTLNIIK
ncbi:MAG: hypothetical protein HYV19_08310 [Gemmatimonadetes bacterium]|nr:hypothetical protein [Gemmatimonadota bacterium]